MFILKYNSIYVCTIFQEEWLEKLMLHFRTCLRKTSSQWCDGIRSENITDSLTDTFRNCLETLSHLKLNYQQIYLHRWMDVARTWHLISSVDSTKYFQTFRYGINVDSLHIFFPPRKFWIVFWFECWLICFQCQLLFSWGAMTTQWSWIIVWLLFD